MPSSVRAAEGDLLNLAPELIVGECDAFESDGGEVFGCGVLGWPVMPSSKRAAEGGRLDFDPGLPVDERDASDSDSGDCSLLSSLSDGARGKFNPCDG